MGLGGLKSRIEQTSTTPKTETAKERRRRLYRFQSDEKPKFPLQQRNFYNHVMENKEVVKTLSLLSTCTHEIRVVGIGVRLALGECDGRF